LDFFRKQNWDIIKHTWIWFGLSGIVIAVGMVAWVTRGLNYGIDFTGGSLLRYQFERPLTTREEGAIQVITDTRQMLANMGLAKSQIQVSGNDSLYIRTPSVANDTEARKRDEKIRAGLANLFGKKAGKIHGLGRETVGPVIGKMLARSAIQALILGVVLILIYVTIRYEFRFAVAAVIALFHDTLVLIGGMALLQTELNTWFVAAILTVLGYSMNDTVIIFDRIRENRTLHRRADLASVVNASLLQTMARSLNTVLTTLFTLIALFVFGGATIHGFALALIIGITSGCYSSIFTASPIVVMWHERARRAKAGAPAIRPAMATATATTATGDAPVTPDELSEPEAGVARPSARETMREAERAAQEAKRQRRRDRRKKKSKNKPSAKRKKRF